MSNGIRGGGRPPPSPTDIPRAPEDTKETSSAKKAPEAGQEAQVPQPEPGPVDQFERGGNIGAQLQARMNALVTAKGAAASKQLQFSNEDLQYLAATFAQIIVQNPNANRLKRARLFTKAILKRRKLRKVFAGVPEQEMEQMCDLIGDVLDSSPVFGQLVDTVSDEAGKLNS